MSRYQSERLNATISCQEALARHMASIMGRCSAASEAISDLERRRQAGEAPIVYFCRGRWLVGARQVIEQTLTSRRQTPR